MGKFSKYFPKKAPVSEETIEVGDIISAKLESGIGHTFTAEVTTISEQSITGRYTIDGFSGPEPRNGEFPKSYYKFTIIKKYNQSEIKVGDKVHAKSKYDGEEIYLRVTSFTTTSVSGNALHQPFKGNVLLLKEDYNFTVIPEDMGWDCDFKEHEIIHF